METAAPSVLRVTSPLNDGVYGAGDALLVDVVFDKPVAVVALNLSAPSPPACAPPCEAVEWGRPYLLLKLGRLAEALDQAVHMWFPPSAVADEYVYLRKAFYHSSKGSVVTFRYVAEALDYSVSLDYVDQASLHLNGASIKRASTKPVVDARVELPAPGSLYSLSGTKKLVVYPLPARVVSVTSTTGSFGAFQEIPINVRFGWGLLAGWSGSMFVLFRVVPPTGLTSAPRQARPKLPAAPARHDKQVSM